MNQSVDRHRLKFLCFGTGAIGTYVGGSLALAGEKVVFLERPLVADQIKANGLCITIDGVEHFFQNPSLATSIREALEQGPFDIGIVAVKSYDTKSLCEELAPYKENLPSLLCLQNGVENESALAEIAGNKIIAGTVTTSVGKKGAGQIVLERLRGIGIASIQPVVPNLVSALNRAGLKARIYHDPGSMKWSKMLTNILANASSAILDMAPKEIFSNKALLNLEVTQFNEATRVMSAMGLGVVNLPGLPTRLLYLAIRYFPFISQPILVRAVGGGRGGKMPSFHIDLYNNIGRSEVDYLNGAVARYGRKFNVPTPVNDLLNRILQEIVRGNLPREEFAHQPGHLISLLHVESAQ